MTIFDLLNHKFIYYNFSKVFAQQIEEFKISSNNYDRELSTITNQCRKYQNEIDASKEQLERSNEHISEYKRKLSKSDSELKMWRTKYETEASQKIDELEEENMNLKSRFDHNESITEDLQNKISILKKQKGKLASELTDLKQEKEVQMKNVEEKVRKLKEMIVKNEQCKKQMSDLNEDLEIIKRENIQQGSEKIQYKRENENMLHQIELFKNEISTLQSNLMKHNDEIHLMDAKVLELDAIKKKLEAEKDDLTATVDDLEFSLNKVNSRYNLLQKELEKAKSEFEKMMEEKDTDSKNAIQKIQYLLETEKSKLESEQKINSELKR